MNASSWGACLISFLALLACAQGGGSSPSVQLAAVPFACPAEGTQTKRIGTATVVTFGKSDDADPAVCAATIGSQAESRWLYNWFRLPTSNEGEKRAAIASAFKGGKEYCYADVNSSSVYEHCWQQVGQKPVSVGGKTYDAVAIRVTEEGRVGNTFAADRIIYYDLASKAIVKLEAVNRRGTPISGYDQEVLKAGP